MRKPVRVILIAVMLLAVLAVVVLLTPSRRGREALAAYKMELRARGEKLTWQELGFPRQPSVDQTLDQLLPAVFRLGQAKYHPGQLKLMEFSAPGRAEICGSTNTSGPTGAWGADPTWEEFLEQMKQESAAIGKIRGALRNPPPYFSTDYSGYPEIPRPPFVELRTAAQWLGGDVIAALHEDELGRAHADLQALTQLTQVHRDELTLVSQMIRVAIGGLGLTVTWEALQSRGWSEEQLAALQKNWEAVDFLAAAEAGLVGERVLIQAEFELARAADWEQPVSAPSAGSGKWEGFVGKLIVGPYHRAHLDDDERLSLEHFQSNLEGVRRLRQGTAWPTVNREFQRNAAELDALTTHPIKKYRYLISGIAIPNVGRVSKSVIRNETMRRMTVIAIALERQRLQQGKYPADLAALAPGPLAVPPTDPMSGQGFRYRLNDDGSFTLYSIGEDGRDDGGDARHPTSPDRFDLWEGRDAVWPTAVR